MKEEKIWLKDADKENTYVDFFADFSVDKKEEIVLNLSCDNVFAVFLNDKMVGFGACQNFINEKKYYAFDITKYVDDFNKLKITVWHQGVDTQTCIKQPAYLMFNVMQGQKQILKSDRNILSAINKNYKSGNMRFITSQLGFTFFYDDTVSENDREMVNSEELGVGYATKNETENLLLKNLAPIKIIENKESFISDMGKETVGFLEYDIDSEVEQDVLITFGERLENGSVPRLIGPRDFSLEVKLKKGKSKNVFPLRRLAGRYLEIFSKSIKINYFGLRIVEYPLIEIPRKFSDLLVQKIYDVSVYTLKCCLHEHYEDCPWREQALYNMDSRNQMLCGYYAFKGSDFQRANLKMMTNGVLKNGMLNICFPSGRELPIPSFNLEYLIQVAEYLDYTKDYSLIDEIGSTVKGIMKCFDNAIDENGLIPNFEYPCWNFYEWSENSSNEEEISRRASEKKEKKYDLIINLLYCYAYSFYDKIFGTKTDLTKMKENIVKMFFIKKDGLFKLSSNCDKYSVLSNSLAILVGLGGREIAEKLINDNTIIPVTLSMNTFFYDALLKIDKSYKEFILQDILKKYKKMLDAGATTFWETELGYKDFGSAGSLCHGWSAMPIYYFNLFNIK